METIVLNTLIEKCIAKAYTYEEYKNLVDALYEKGKVTGHAQSEALLDYTMLNQRRMKRWEKTLRVPLEVETIVKNYTKEIYWLVISEGWCGDAAHNLPVLKKLADLNTNIQLGIVLRDDNEALMNEFLTNGGKSIPKLIMYNPATKTVENTWGPRPSEATKLVEAYKAIHGSLDAAFKEDLQRWYNQDKGQNAMADLIKLLQ